MRHSLKNSVFIFNDKLKFILNCEQKVIDVIKVNYKERGN